MFNNGIAQGLIISIFNGGQIHLISGEGLKLIWKKDQKKEKKDITNKLHIKSIITLYLEVYR